MVLRPPARAATAAACALLAAGGLAACHHGTANPRSKAGTPSATSGAAARKRQRPPAGGGGLTLLPKGVTPSATPSASPSRGSRAEGPLPPVISHLPVRDKVVFITIDDGWEKDADFVHLVSRHRIPLTLFLANMAIKKDYGYFRELQRAGALIEDHTMTHPYLPGLPYARQKHEICAAADIYARQYGSRPTLMRAPYGATRDSTLRAARDCGMKAVFFWREVVSNGHIAYQVAGRLHRGDILLVHFNPNMTADFKRMLHTIGEQGFKPAALASYLPKSYLTPARGSQLE
jgi:peptidoglycan/xylan/chitin deacetylase (PgdA/CDA1 family)